MVSSSPPLCQNLELIADNFHRRRSAGDRARRAYTTSRVTTRKFLEVFGLASLRGLPDIERLEDGGVLQRPAAEADLDGVRGIGEDVVELAEELEND
jgi:chromosome segregation and condensation protein ScpB